jgi:hypothetical protein
VRAVRLRAKRGFGELKQCDRQRDNGQSQRTKEVHKNEKKIRSLFYWTLISCSFAIKFLRFAIKKMNEKRVLSFNNEYLKESFMS